MSTPLVVEGHSGLKHGNERRAHDPNDSLLDSPHRSSDDISLSETQEQNSERVWNATPTMESWNRLSAFIEELDELRVSEL